MCMQKLAAAKYALQSCKSRMTPWSNSFHIFRYVVILGFRIEGKRKKRETEERDTAERETKKRETYIQ